MNFVSTNSKSGCWKTTASQLIASGAMNGIWQASSKVLVKKAYATWKSHEMDVNGKKHQALQLVNSGIKAVHEAWANFPMCSV